VRRDGFDAIFQHLQSQSCRTRCVLAKFDSLSAPNPSLDRPSSSYIAKQGLPADAPAAFRAAASASPARTVVSRRVWFGARGGAGGLVYRHRLRMRRLTAHTGLFTGSAPVFSMSSKALRISCCGRSESEAGNHYRESVMPQQPASEAVAAPPSACVRQTRWHGQKDISYQVVTAHSVLPQLLGFDVAGVSDEDVRSARMSFRS